MQTFSLRLTQFFVAVAIVTLCIAAANEATAGDKSGSFVDTKSGQALKIDPAMFNTEQAKKFMATGQNSYIGDKQAEAQGKKLYQLYSCAQCHGAQAQGQTAGGLIGPRFAHAKSANDKGMFEIIWAGTNGGMSGKGKGHMDPTNADNGLSVDETLKVIAWIRSQGTGGK